MLGAPRRALAQPEIEAFGIFDYAEEPDIDPDNEGLPPQADD